MSVQGDTDRIEIDGKNPGHENFCEQLESYIQTNPLRALMIALFAGIAVAKILL